MTGYTTGTNNQLTNDGTYSYEYDDEGNRTKRTNDTTGELTEYEWDFRNRLTKVTEKDGTSATTKVVEYTYDVFNRRIGKEVDTTTPFDRRKKGGKRVGRRAEKGSGVFSETSDPDSTYAYTYDNLGRVLTVDNTGTPGVANVVLSSAYDANDNRTSLSATIDGADDFANTYTYDSLNRLTQLVQEGQTGGNSVAEKRVDFAYNLANQFTTIARYNDADGGSANEVATSTYSYDTLGRLTGLDYERGGTDLFTPYSWTYDSTNRITQFVSADGTSDYTYDKTSQLTGADHDYQTDESYTYDANGNRTMTGYTTGTNNQLTNDGSYSYEYDDEGNRTKRTNDTTGEVTEYEWDFRNRLMKVTEKDGTSTTTKVVEYTYDVFNRRIGKEVDTTSPFDMADAAIERYVYDDLNGVESVDGGNVVLDFADPDGSGSQPAALSSRQLFGNAVDQILAQEDVTESLTSPDRVLWHLTDHLQTVRALARNDGTIAVHYKYDSFGKVTSGDTSVTRYLYTAREFDGDVELQYSRARWYDALAGRWTSEDPLGFDAGDENTLRYVGNNPAAQTDPSGLREDPNDNIFDPIPEPPAPPPAPVPQQPVWVPFQPPPVWVPLQPGGPPMLPPPQPPFPQPPGPPIPMQPNPPAPQQPNPPAPQQPNPPFVPLPFPFPPILPIVPIPVPNPFPPEPIEPIIIIAEPEMERPPEIPDLPNPEP